MSDRTREDTGVLGAPPAWESDPEETAELIQGTR